MILSGELKSLGRARARCEIDLRGKAGSPKTIRQFGLAAALQFPARSRFPSRRAVSCSFKVMVLFHIASYYCVIVYTMLIGMLNILGDA